jgi:hypothetical protein
MVDFMLNDLRGPASEVLCVRFHFESLELHFDGLIAFALARASEKR